MPPRPETAGGRDAGERTGSHSGGAGQSGGGGSVLPGSGLLCQRGARCYTGNTIRGERFFPGWLQDPQEPFIRDILAGLEAAGLTPAVRRYSFCTNGSHYAGEAGIPTVGLGPSREDLAHTVDEYVELDQLEQACESDYALLCAL